MNILLDECLPVELKGHVLAAGHNCQIVREAGFASQKNGALLALAEGRWDVLLTSDRNIKYQQNMTGRNISILILRARSTRMRDLVPLMPACSQALLSIQPGSVSEVGPMQETPPR
jgi:predicted nuclease of predicted toxin-antitoxin system